MPQQGRQQGLLWLGPNYQGFWPPAPPATDGYWPQLLVSAAQLNGDLSFGDSHQHITLGISNPVGSSADLQILTSRGQLYLSPWDSSSGQSNSLMVSGAAHSITLAAVSQSSTNVSLLLTTQGTGTVQINGSQIMTNPMTAVGDLIVGGTAGAATRLAATTNGYVLTLVGGVPSWRPAGAAAVPITSGGDIGLQPDGVANNALNAQNAAGAVNGIQVQGSATGVAPIISAVGTDTNIGITIATHGTGAVTVNTNALSVLGPTNPIAELGVAGGAVVIVALNTSSATYFSDSQSGDAAFSGGGAGFGIIRIGPGAWSRASALRIAAAAASVNGVRITGESTGVAPIIAAEGTDTNVGLAIKTQGTGVVTINGSTVALLTTSTPSAMPTAWGQAPTLGAATTAALADHSHGTMQDPTADGYAVSMDMHNNGGNQTAAVANDCWYSRVDGGGTVTNLNFNVATSSGSMDIGIAPNAGAGAAGQPSGAMIATKGGGTTKTAMPAAGGATMALGSTPAVSQAQYWWAIAIDNVTAAIKGLSSGITGQFTTNGANNKQTSNCPIGLNVGALGANAIGPMIFST